MPRLVRLLAVLCVATGLVSAAVDLGYALLYFRGELHTAAAGGGFAVAVRAGWAVVRAYALAVLPRRIARRKPGARPVAAVLALSAAFGVVRLAWIARTPDGIRALLITGSVLVVVLAAAVIVLLTRPVVTEHLTPPPGPDTGSRWTRRGADRPIWVAAAGYLALWLVPLTAVPFLVATGAVFGDRSAELGLLGAAVTVPILLFWLGLLLVLYLVVPYSVLALTFGFRAGRWPVLAGALVALATQPLLCLLLLGPDSLLTDGLPLAAVAGIIVYGLTGHRSARDYFSRSARSTAPVA